MIHTTSITALRDRLAETIDSLDPNHAILIVRHSKPAAYLVSRELYENLLERVEDLEDKVDMTAAVIDFYQGKTLEAIDVFEKLGV